MLRTNWLRVALGIVCLGVAITNRAIAQPTARVLPPKFADGSYKVIIDGDTLWAITTKMAKQFADSMSVITRLRGEVAARDTLIRQLRQTVVVGGELIDKFKAYEVTLQAQSDGYKHLSELVEAYHKRGQRIALELGAGLTGGDPAVVAGLSVFRVRTWLFLQKDNAGAMFGGSLPIW